MHPQTSSATILLLIGPPAAGKDTITAELAAADPRYVLCPKVKVGTGRTTGYRFLSRQQLDDLDGAGRIVTVCTAYGNLYAIDKADIEAIHARGGIPVVHSAHPAEIAAIQALPRVRVVSVLVWADASETLARLEERDPSDIQARTAEFDAIRAELSASNLTVTAQLETTYVPAVEAAGFLRRLVDDEAHEASAPCRW